MSKAATLITRIKNEQIGKTGKKALIVEGVDDVEAFQTFLRKKDATWDQRWVVAPANGKSKVTDVLALEPDWLGVVDRDEWTDEEAARAAQAHANLVVLPRFCVESYLVDPDELWAALPDKQRALIPGGEGTLRAEIEKNLAAWKRHAALWHVIHPLYRQMRSADHRDRLLDPSHVPDDAELADIVNAWLQNFDTARIRNDVAGKLASYELISPAEFYRQHVYAKKFYSMVVHPVLDSLLGQRPDQVRWKALLRTMALPDDLDPLWERMAPK